MLLSNWDICLEDRLNYRPQRRVRLRHAPIRWAHSMLREVGEFLFGPFAEIGEDS